MDVLTVAAVLAGLVAAAEGKFKFLWNHRYRQMPPVRLWKKNNFGAWKYSFECFAKQYIGREEYSESQKEGLRNLHSGIPASDVTLNMTFEDWWAARGEDGFLCGGHRSRYTTNQEPLKKRSRINDDDRDCDWIHPDLFCQPYDVDPDSAAWPGASGYCACPVRRVWDEGEVQFPARHRMRHLFPQQSLAGPSFRFRNTFSQIRLPAGRTPFWRRFCSC